MSESTYQTTLNESVLMDVSKIFSAFVDELSKLISSVTLSSTGLAKSGIWRSVATKQKIETLIHLLSESMILYAEDAALKHWKRAELKMNDRAKKALSSSDRTFNQDELVRIFNINLNNLPASSFSVDEVESFSFDKRKLKAFLSGSFNKGVLSVRERVESITQYLIDDIEFIVKENIESAGSMASMDSHLRELMISMRYKRNRVFMSYLNMLSLLSKIAYIEAMLNRREILETIIPDYRSKN
ncbi:hypothetical protein [Prolixibacter denitrificans]|uniref:Uncharacterized protein n=1 Tax=Prolixibacter denitrificans TaxID=1541063 RepID=A0A2P8CJX1_9BACT|nr:hypothetical protein [Prolixibacter denitrificans]PSK85254.1 hypothetical protein CLV93_101206 [Prolixibacter denitrificans]GET19876.1 hypothetical protein JCM18694_01220 [Prolixibacter denitrificans]